jgi:hypothetical protein
LLGRGSERFGAHPDGWPAEGMPPVTRSLFGGVGSRNPIPTGTDLFVTVDDPRVA